MKSDLDPSTKTNKSIPIAQGHTHTLLSRVRFRGKIKLFCFKPNYVKFNYEVLKKMNDESRGCVFLSQEMIGTFIADLI